jgi:hypothetical protein
MIIPLTLLRIIHVQGREPWYGVSRFSNRREPRTPKVSIVCSHYSPLQHSYSGTLFPPHFQERILHNVWCPHCGDMTTMTDFTGEVHGRSLVLSGTCVTCRGKVARVLEGALVSEALQAGDRVIWWKRIPGGDYVYPVQATVLALTGKRVKIEADDDGDIVVRYVPRERLQHQG